MFGYVRVDKEQLKNEDFDAYRAVYCSLCKTLGKEYSVFSRFLLNYDCTFFSLFALSFQQSDCAFCDGRCRFNPFKKCRYLENEKEKSLSLAAALTISSAYFKLVDDIQDAGFIKRCFLKALKPLLNRWRTKAKSRFPDIDSALETMSNEQQLVEKREDCSIDAAAHPSAQMLSRIFRLIPTYLSIDTGLDSEKEQRVLKNFGYSLGRWVYLIDAADDFSDDKKHGDFNIFLLCGCDENSLFEQTLPLLNHALSNAALSYGLMKQSRYDTLISNVLYQAMPKIQQEVLSKYQKPQSS